MRQLVELEASRESLSRVDHELGLFLVLAARHISGVLHLLSRREDLALGTGVATGGLRCPRRALRLWSDELIWLVDLAGELDHESLLLELLDLEQLLIDWTVSHLVLSDRIRDDLGDLLVVVCHHLMVRPEALTRLLPGHRKPRSLLGGQIHVVEGTVQGRVALVEGDPLILVDRS